MLREVKGNEKNFRDNVTQTVPFLLEIIGRIGEISFCIHIYLTARSMMEDDGGRE
jgi:hypothetical protein